MKVENPPRPPGNTPSNPPRSSGTPTEKPARIIKTEVTSTDLTLALSNGVTVHLAVHNDRLHLHLGGIEGNLVATPFLTIMANVPRLEVANHIDIGYKPRRE